MSMLLCCRVLVCGLFYAPQISRHSQGRKVLVLALSELRLICADNVVLLASLNDMTFNSHRGSLQCETVKSQHLKV